MSDSTTENNGFYCDIFVTPTTPTVVLSISTGTSLATRCIGAKFGPSKVTSSPEKKRKGISQI